MKKLRHYTFCTDFKKLTFQKPAVSSQSAKNKGNSLAISIADLFANSFHSMFILRLDIYMTIVGIQSTSYKKREISLAEKTNTCPNKCQMEMRFYHIAVCIQQRIFQAEFPRLHSHAYAGIQMQTAAFLRHRDETTRIEFVKKKEEFPSNLICVYHVLYTCSISKIPIHAV